MKDDGGDDDLLTNDWEFANGSAWIGATQFSNFFTSKAVVASTDLARVAVVVVGW